MLANQDYRPSNIDLSCNILENGSMLDFNVERYIDRSNRFFIRGLLIRSNNGLSMLANLKLFDQYAYINIFTIEIFLCDKEI